jgi:hypothetical protein
MFPTATLSELWSGWNLNYDSQVTTSSFSNGDLTSNLNTESDLYTPNQPGDFNLTKGSFTQYGDLATIDANYSTIKSTNAILQTDEFIDSITYTKGSSGVGTLENTQTDDSYYKQINPKSTYYGNPIFDYKYEIDVYFNIDPVYAGRDFYFSCDIVTGVSA